MDKLKKWIKERFKQWAYCDIARLHKENEKSKLWAATFLFNSFIFLGIFYYSFVNGFYEAAIIALIMDVYCVLMGVDSSNDRNRINMWIFLKENVENEKRTSDNRR